MFFYVILNYASIITNSDIKDLNITEEQYSHNSNNLPTFTSERNYFVSLSQQSSNVKYKVCTEEALSRNTKMKFLDIENLSKQDDQLNQENFDSFLILSKDFDTSCCFKDSIGPCDTNKLNNISENSISISSVCKDANKTRCDNLNNIDFSTDYFNNILLNDTDVFFNQGSIVESSDSDEPFFYDFKNLSDDDRGDTLIEQHSYIYGDNDIDFQNDEKLNLESLFPISDIINNYINSDLDRRDHNQNPQCSTDYYFQYNDKMNKENIEADNASLDTEIINFPDDCCLNKKVKILDKNVKKKSNNFASSLNSDNSFSNFEENITDVKDQKGDDIVFASESNNDDFFAVNSLQNNLHIILVKNQQKFCVIRENFFSNVYKHVKTDFISFNFVKNHKYCTMRRNIIEHFAKLSKCLFKDFDSKITASVTLNLPNNIKHLIIENIEFYKCIVKFVIDLKSYIKMSKYGFCGTVYNLKLTKYIVEDIIALFDTTIKNIYEVCMDNKFFGSELAHDIKKVIIILKSEIILLNNRLEYIYIHIKKFAGFLDAIKQ